MGGQTGDEETAQDDYDRDAMRAMIQVLNDQDHVQAVEEGNRVWFTDEVLINERICTYEDDHDDHGHFNIVLGERRPP